MESVNIDGNGHVLDSTNDLAIRLATETLQSFFRRWRACRSPIKYRKIASTENIVLNMAAETITKSLRKITSKTKLKLPSSLSFEAHKSTALEPQIDRHHHNQDLDLDTIIKAVDNNHTLSTGQHDNLTLSTGHHDNVKLPCSENSEAIELVSEVVKNHPSSNQVLSTMDPSSSSLSSAVAFHSIIITNISVSKVDNVVWRGTNDLYCVFELNGWEYHTSVIEEAGDKASWNYIQRINHDDDHDDEGFMNGSNGGLLMLPFISDITDDLQISSSSHHHHHQNSINNENHHLHDDNDDDDFIHISNTASSYNKNNNKNVLTIKLYHKNLIVSDKLIGGVDVMLSNYITSELNTTDSIQIIENIYELSSSSSSLIKQKVKSRGVITMSFLACHHQFNTIYAKSNHQYHSKYHDLIRTNHNYGGVVVVDNKLLSDTSDWKKAESILDFTEQSTSTTTTNNNINSSRNRNKGKDTVNIHKQQRKPPIHEGITSCIITNMDDNNGDVNIVVNDDGTSSNSISHINNGNCNVKQSNNKYSHHNKINYTKNILRNNFKVSNNNNNNNSKLNNNNNNDNNNNLDGNYITTNVGAAAATSILSSSSIHTNLTVISTTITATSKSAAAAATTTTTALTTTSKKNNVRLPYLYSVLQNVSMIKNNTDLLRSKGNLVYDEAYRLSVKKMSSFIKLTIYEFATILYKLDVPVYHSLVFCSNKLLGQGHYQQHQQQQQKQQHYDGNGGDDGDGDDAKTFQLPLTHSMSLAATMSFIIEEHNMIDISRLKQSYSKTSSSSSSSSSSSFSVTNNNQFVLSEDLCERALSYMVTLVEGSYSELRGIILTACEGGEGNDLKNNNINNSLGMIMIHRVGIDDIADDICDVYN